MNVDKSIQLNKTKLLCWVLFILVMMVYCYYIVFFASSNTKDDIYLFLMRSDFPFWMVYSACLVTPLDFVYFLKLIISRKKVLKIENAVISCKFPFLKLINLEKKDIKDIYITNNNILVIISKNDFEKTLIAKMFDIIAKMHNNYIEKNIIKVNLNFFKNVDKVDIFRFHPSYTNVQTIINNQNLDEKQKIIELYELKKLSQKEIGLFLNINVSKVNKTIRKYIDEKNIKKKGVNKK